MHPGRLLVRKLGISGYAELYRLAGQAPQHLKWSIYYAASPKGSAGPSAVKVVYRGEFQLSRPVGALRHPADERTVEDNAL
jgi:hypothetical protein